MYEIKVFHQKPDNRNMPGEWYIVEPGLKKGPSVPFYYPEAKYRSAERNEAEALEFIYDILEMMKVKSYKHVDDCTGALTRDWAERAPAGVAA